MACDENYPSVFFSQISPVPNPMAKAARPLTPNFEGGGQMKIFITGGTGFIGTHVAQRLTRSDHELFCLVRKTSNVSYLDKLGANLVVGDVTDKASLAAGMRGCDWVIHLANVYSYWEPDKRIYTDINVNGTQKVMGCALETGISKVVHVSSIVVYGKPAEHPFTEESPVGLVRFSEYARSN